MQFTDTLAIDGVKTTADGYLAANVRVARTGIQLYTGDQLGKPEMKTVRVYRPESEVFAGDAMKSYAHRPVTVDHPPIMVDAENWKELSVGHTGDEVMRDGQAVRVSMLVMDGAAINAVKSGKRELSMGYTADIEWGDGETPDGEPYDAIQRNTRMNHLAIVAKARGGSTLKIGDKKPKGDSAMTDKTTSLVLDGITVTVPTTDAANVKALFDAKDKALAGATAALSDANQKLTDANKKAETLEGEKAVLEKQVEDAALTPEKMTEAVAARTALLGDAKALLGDSTDLAKLTDAQIKREVVAKVLGDTAKDMTDAAIDGAYAMAAKTAKSDPMRKALSDGLGKTDITDAETERAKMMTDKQNAWKGAA